MINKNISITADDQFNLLELTKVSVIIPVLNEEDYIQECLESLLCNDYPMQRVEFLVFDGGSTDRSRSIVADMCERYGNIKITENPLRKQVHALNLGIDQSSGDIIIRADAHCLYQNDYISRCVSLLNSGIAESVGGQQFACGQDYITTGIAIAFRSLLGSGNADYRVGKVSKYTDTVFLGAWRKSTLLKLNGFDDSMDINEDYELNVRIIKFGGRIYYTPDLKTIYFVRKGISKLAMQYFKYGKWKVKTLTMHTSSIKLRQALLPIAIILILSSAVAYIFTGLVFYIIPLAVYLSVCILGSIFAENNKMNLRYLPITFVAIVTMHFCWVFGFYAGCMNKMIDGFFGKNLNT